MSIALGGALLVAIGLFVWLTPSTTPAVAPVAPKVGVIVLREQPVTLTPEFSGRIVARELSEVRLQVSGVIRQRLFEEGAYVRRGQLRHVIEGDRRGLG